MTTRLAVPIRGEDTHLGHPREDEPHLHIILDINPRKNLVEVAVLMFPRRSSPEPMLDRRQEESRGRSPRRLSPGPSSSRKSNWESQPSKSQQAHGSVSPHPPSPPPPPPPAPPRRTSSRHRSVSPPTSPKYKNNRSSRYSPPPPSRQNQNNNNSNNNNNNNNNRNNRRPSSPFERRISPFRRRKFSPPPMSRSKRDRRNKRRKGSPRRRSPPHRPLSRRSSRSPVGGDLSPTRPIANESTPLRQLSRTSQLSHSPPTSLEEVQLIPQQAPVEVFLKEIDMLKENENISPRAPPSEKNINVIENSQPETNFRPRSPIPSGPRSHGIELGSGRGYKARNYDHDFNQLHPRKKRSPKARRRGGGAVGGDHYFDDSRSPPFGNHRPPRFTGANAIPTGPAHQSSHQNKSRYQESFRHKARHGNRGSISYSHHDYSEDEQDPAQADANAASENPGSMNYGRGESYDNMALETDNSLFPTSTVEGNDATQMQGSSDLLGTGPGASRLDQNGTDAATIMPPPSLSQAPSVKTTLEAPSKPIGGDEPKGKIRFSLSKSNKPHTSLAGKFDTPSRGRSGSVATSANNTPVGPRKSHVTEDTPTRPDPPQRTSSMNETKQALQTRKSVTPMQRTLTGGILQRTTSIYDRICMVGEGTYGKVYKAQNAASKQLVALKRIRLEQERDGV